MSENKTEEKSSDASNQINNNKENTGDFVNKQIQSTKIEDIYVNLNNYTTKNRTLKIALLAIFTALGPALSISFVWLPYFELMTITIFIGAMLLGPLYGMILALLSSILFEILVTVIIGPGFPIYPFKVLAYILIALAGSYIGKHSMEKTKPSWRLFIATLGGLLTLVFDLLTTIGMVIFLKMPIINYFILLATGLWVTTIRILTNTTLFAFIPEIEKKAIRPILRREKTKKRINGKIKSKIVS